MKPSKIYLDPVNGYLIERYRKGCHHPLFPGQKSVPQHLRKGLTRRVFRRMLDGSLEWAAYDDWRMHNERARFFGFASRELPASMTS